jgi:hypothetical protein
MPNSVQDLTAVLLINPTASLNDLHSCAMERFRAVKDLMECLSFAHSSDTGEKDLSRLANAAHLLLREGCDVLEVLEVRMANAA